MDEVKPKKRPFFDREMQQYIVIGTFYVLLATVSRIDLTGTALLVFGSLAGLGIYKHSLKLVEINISGEKKV